MNTLNRNNTFVKKRPVKILQFGEGNFLRGFVDWMVDEMNEKAGFDGDIQIIQPLNEGMGEKLNDQDGLYHLQLQGIQNGAIVDKLKLITCVQGVINPYQDYQAYLSLAANPDLQFVISNTTEAGITFDPNDILQENTVPHTFPGKLTALLYQRFQIFDGNHSKKLIIIPCELIDKNGEMLKKCVLQYAELWDLPIGFHKWIEESNLFYNTLVDRIVPGFPKDNIFEIQQKIGFEDSMIVKAEPFHLWVIEGPQSLREIFPADQAELEVKFVEDLSPFRTRKVRILNGAHTAMVPLAYLKGIRTVREAIEDEEMGAIIRETIFKEIIPTLDLPSEELKKYANEVLDRFRNPFIRHELASIALNSISKFKVRVLPSMVEYHQNFGTWPKNLVKSLAALILFYRGECNGESLPLNDGQEILDFFKAVWKKGNMEEIVTSILTQEEFWGIDLSKEDELISAVNQAILNLSYDLVS
ncbi:tagaturonate reductase [Fontibacter flavus]|uniref:Tagaturonate reductase n=1 Tax=Fontibacter flavus TaxID=654838 RepID=A0ABV6FRT5_9BACT